jgi:hypothetical protein
MSAVPWISSNGFGLSLATGCAPASWLEIAMTVVTIGFSVPALIAIAPPKVMTDERGALMPDTFEKGKRGERIEQALVEIVGRAIVHPRYRETLSREVQSEAGIQHRWPVESANCTRNTEYCARRIFGTAMHDNRNCSARGTYLELVGTCDFVAGLDRKNSHLDVFAGHL